GLIFLMTGGGPSGATKLYSILAYEKAIGSLQYGPGSAIAFSVAPLMAIMIWLLARFMRQDDRATTDNKKAGIGDRVLGVFGRAFSVVLDVVVWPLDKIYRGLEQMGRWITQLV